MLSCSEVTRLCASEELRHAPWLRRLRVRLHLLICDHCKRYVRELRLIGAAVRSEARRLWPDRGPLEALELSLRDRIRAEIRNADRSPPP